MRARIDPWAAGLMCILRVVVTGAQEARAQPGGTVETHLYTRAESRLGLAAADSLWRGDDGRELADLGLTVRPLFSGKLGKVRWNAQIDAILSAGDSRERLVKAGLDEPEGAALTDRDLLDLARTWSEGKRHRHTLRVDRLNLVFSPDWGTVTVGRHVVTWGGGFFFNPFDLFNPFAPSEVVRDFKVGSDMIHFDVPWRGGNVQALAVGRRDPADGDPSLAASSFALQAKGTTGALDWTVMGAWHYDEPVLGVGTGGTVAGATWRIEGTWVRVRPEFPGGLRDYASIVANAQFAWVWGGKNTFGVFEYYFNGLGERDHAAARADPVVATQLRRGNVFALGRHYAAASVQMEWHPLLNLFAGAIVNLEDPSFLLQPRFLWDASETLRVTAGVDIPVGPQGSEFGGYRIPGVTGTTRAPTTFYALATWEF